MRLSMLMPTTTAQTRRLVLQQEWAREPQVGLLREPLLTCQTDTGSDGSGAAATHFHFSLFVTVRVVPIFKHHFHFPSDGPKALLLQSHFHFEGKV
jgi:hypothetical protein